MSNSGITELVDQVITGRRSIRAFIPTQIDTETIFEILEKAARAPSGSNTQPWNVYIVKGDGKSRLSDAVLSAYSDAEGAINHTREYDYYPQIWESPYIERRRKTGWGLYSLLGIRKGDKIRMREQHARNFIFFDAPVGLIFTIDAKLALGSWLDYGMFLQNIMILARARGLDTCPQAAFIEFPEVIRHCLSIPAGQKIVCGMSLGYADAASAENQLLTEREPASSFIHLVDE